MKLRLPLERLAGAVWLPRFVDKVRAEHAGELPADYRIAFCHPRGVDGHFLRHFDLNRDTALAGVLSSPDDDAVAKWFRAQPGVTDASISAWNDLAPTIGREDRPGRDAFLFMRRRIYGEVPPVPLESAFAMIYYDETGSAEAR